MNAITAALLPSLWLGPPSLGTEDLESLSLRDRILSLIAHWNRDDSPGGVLAVLEFGEPICVESFGMANLETKRPNDPTTLFYLASLAKPITGFCAVHASQNSSLDLDASVRELFPELSEVYQSATLRHALHHLSGLPDVYDAAIATDQPLATIASNQAAVEFLSRLETPCFPAGERFLYSNSGYVLLAEAIQRSTGVKFSEYARTHLFESFGMEQARYLGGNQDDVACSYQRRGDRWSEQQVATGMHGPGGLVASLDDLIAFEQGLLDLEEERKRALFDRPAKARHPRLGAYSAGWLHQRHRGLRVERHFGGGFGFSTDLLRFPDHELTVIVLANASDLSATHLSESIADIVLEKDVSASEPRQPPTVSLIPEQAQRFGRFWRDLARGVVWVLLPRKDHIEVRSLGDLEISLVPVSPQRLEAWDTAQPFALELESGELVVWHDEQEWARLEQIPAPSRETSLSDFVGRYENLRIGARIRLTITSDGRLKLEQREPILPLPPFQPVGRDVFVCDRGAQISFHRDRKGDVHGLTMHANRAWNLGFDKMD